MRLLLAYPKPRTPALVREHPHVHLRLCELTDAIMASIPGVRLPLMCEPYSPGLLWLATYARSRGIDATLVDLDQLVCEADLTDCCVGFTATAPDIPLVLRIARQLRESNPRVLIAIGGAFAQSSSLEDAEMLFKSGINVIDRGNGSALIDIVKDGPPPSPNFTRLRSGISTTLLPGVSKPDYALLGDRIAMTVPNVFTALGCKGSCAFCSSAGTIHIERPVGEVVEELLDLSQSLPEGSLVHFTDCDFLANPSRAQDLLSRLPCTLRYSCDCHLISARSDLLQTMWAAGFVRVNFGIEDLCCGRSALRMKELPDVRERLLAARSVFPGVIRGYFMVGLPGINSKGAGVFLNQIHSLLSARIIDIATLKALVPYPNTYLSRHPEKFGLTILTSDLECYKRLDHPVYELDSLSSKEIEDLLLRALDIAVCCYEKRMDSVAGRTEFFGSCNYTRGQVSFVVPDQGAAALVSERGKA